MDDKNQKIKRPKRQPKVEENFWDCSVCTYRNPASEAFKCLVCDVRKGLYRFFAKILWNIGKFALGGGCEIPKIPMEVNFSRSDDGKTVGNPKVEILRL